MALTPDGKYEIMTASDIILLIHVCAYYLHSPENKTLATANRLSEFITLFKGTLDNITAPHTTKPTIFDSPLDHTPPNETDTIN